MEWRPHPPGRLASRILALVGIELLARGIGLVRSDAERNAVGTRDQTAADPHRGEHQRQLLGLAPSDAGADRDELRHPVRHMPAGEPSA